jgi:hypothetical protein
VAVNAVRNDSRAIFLVAVATACEPLPDDANDRWPMSGSTVSSTADGGSVATLTPFPTDGGDSADTAVEPPCDAIDHSGCEADQVCRVVRIAGTLTTVCATDVPSVDPYSQCTKSLVDGRHGCPAGYVCLGESDRDSICVPSCNDDADCDGSSCALDRFDAVPYCAASCLPFSPACPQGLQCRRDGSRFACSFATGDDIGTTGAECSQPGDSGCKDGFVCLPGSVVSDCGFAKCCTGLCELPNGSCADPAQCTAFLPDPSAEFESVGACLVPIAAATSPRLEPGCTRYGVVP